MKKILFITWDGPQTSYMEGLFMPIFQEIQKQHPHIHFHCLQFTWDNDGKVQQETAKKYNINYTLVPIARKPVASLASFYTLLQGHRVIRRYVKAHQIDVLMPRSNFPAFMVNRANLNIPIVFDADGLPIEERIDFANLKRGSLMQRFLEHTEMNMLRKARTILTRSDKAIRYHLEKQPTLEAGKFKKVVNGRDILKFRSNNEDRHRIRKELSVNFDTKLLVYAGSFGPQYGWEEMYTMVNELYKINYKFHFLFLTGSPEKIKELIPDEMRNLFTVKRVDFNLIPSYLSAGDLAFAIRKPSLSMQGVAPIKLGEYLLMGLPTIASRGIGDTEELLQEIPGTFLFDHHHSNSINKAIQFITTENGDRQNIRNKAIGFFSLEESAKSYLKAI